MVPIYLTTSNLSDLDGVNGLAFNGGGSGREAGTSVSSAGDINGDGIDDLIISDPRATTYGGYSTGASYVVLGGGITGTSGVVELSDLNGIDGFVVNGVDSFDQSASSVNLESVSSAGDINGDGVDDLIIGAPGADPGGDSAAGESYVGSGTMT